MGQNIDDMVFMGAIWPENRLVGGYDLQIALGCDPIVCHLFDSKFVTKHSPENGEPVMLWSAKRSDWVRFAKTWFLEKKERDDIRRETSLGLH